MIDKQIKITLEKLKIDNTTKNKKKKKITTKQLNGIHLQSNHNLDK